MRLVLPSLFGGNGWRETRRLPRHAFASPPSSSPPSSPSPTLYFQTKSLSTFSGAILTLHCHHRTFSRAAHPTTTASLSFSFYFLFWFYYYTEYHLQKASTPTHSVAWKCHKTKSPEPDDQARVPTCQRKANATSRCSTASGSEALAPPRVTPREHQEQHQFQLQHLHALMRRRRANAQSLCLGAGGSNKPASPRKHQQQ